MNLHFTLQHTYPTAKRGCYQRFGFPQIYHCDRSYHSAFTFQFSLNEYRAPMEVITGQRPPCLNTSFS